jgi:hypothetical protein
MKKITLTFYSLLSIFLAHAQPETPPAPKPRSLLIKLATNENNSNVVNFNSIDWKDYPNTTEFDFSRMTPLSKLQSAVSESWVTPEDLPISIIDIDDETYTIEGTVSPTSTKTQKIILGNSTYMTTRVEFKEEYKLLNNGSTLATYTSHYYSYFDSSQLVFEVFTKWQDLGDDLSQFYEGISFNIEDKSQQQNDISLILNPNPSNGANQVLANFNLWANGFTTVSISNQLSTFNRVVYSGDLQSGSNSIPIPIRDFQSGIYVVTVLFNGQMFSSNLIIQ